MSSLPIPRQFTAKTISAEKGWNGPPALPCYNLRTPRLGRRAERREAPEGAGSPKESAWGSGGETDEAPGEATKRPVPLTTFAGSPLKVPAPLSRDRTARKRSERLTEGFPRSSPKP